MTAQVDLPEVKGAPNLTQLRGLSWVKREAEPWSPPPEPCLPHLQVYRLVFGPSPVLDAISGLPRAQGPWSHLGSSPLLRMEVRPPVSGWVEIGPPLIMPSSTIVTSMGRRGRDRVAVCLLPERLSLAQLRESVEARSHSEPAPGSLLSGDSSLATPRHPCPSGTSIGTCLPGAADLHSRFQRAGPDPHCAKGPADGAGKLPGCCVQWAGCIPSPALF